MRKTLFVASMLLSVTAHADLVQVTSVTDMDDPKKPSAISSTSVYAFTPETKAITFKIAGKTCNFVSSVSAIGPMGCNYSLTVNNSTLTLSSPSSSGNTGCTAASEMLTACK